MVIVGRSIFMVLSDKRILKKSISKINNDKFINEDEKETRIKIVKEILKEKDTKQRYSKLYDMICDYLDHEFICKNVCGFNNGICSKRQYMIDRGIKKDSYENGCCHGYKEKKTCEHLKNGRCSIKNIACKIFTCPFLKLKGINYSINKIYFARYFFNFRQKFYMQNTYFVDKDIILEGILKRM